ncbi:multidrug resistance-associated protein 1-like [Dendronephthya gigantea]|uniref:multidrug resistance-associated protein 1-like n=1 Tax=Dendronephthya gigantea TaxID=151771 RepID=UPI00106BCEFB|nr:multidrug resistance-associated protein 1-like [Dendronephthya gigantea]
MLAQVKGKKDMKAIPKKAPTHVVALYNYLPTEDDIFNESEPSYIAPDANVQLTIRKGDIFELTGELGWWLFVESSDHGHGYVPSYLMVPVKYDVLTADDLKVLSHGGDVPPSAIDTEVDLAYFPDALSDEKDIGVHREICPEENANIFSRMTIWWLTSLIYRGYKNPLTDKDLWALSDYNSSKEIVPKFLEAWSREEEKIAALKTKSEKKSKNYEGVETDDVTIIDKDKKKKEPRPSLLKTIGRVFGKIFFISFLLKLVQDVCVFTQPQLLKLIIEYVEDKDNKMESWSGYVLALAMLVVAMIQTICLQNNFYLTFTAGMRIRTAIIGAVYRKALVLSNASRNLSTAGELVNLMSVDCQKILEITSNFAIIWSTPLQIIFGLVFLFRTLGVSVLSGLAMMILLMPVNMCSGKLAQKYQKKQMLYKDSRAKTMNEILNGIKVLKLYAWEKSFIEKVLGIRKLELHQLKLGKFVWSALSFTYLCAPFAVSVVTFGTYVLLGNTLTASKAFVALALFNILRFPLTALPWMLMNLIQGLVSARRIATFLSLPELDSECIKKTSETDDVISIVDGTFSWGENQSPVLKNINIHVKKGSLVAVVGQVGCGKSSLLSGLLGEMEKSNGEVIKNGSTAYVPQQAWIQNDTVRENILFGKCFDPKRYHKVIDSCALTPDLEVLAAGDKTQIGERGVNLSGGQKQRINLARAVYFNADIYLLDDPLSAVDAHVGKHIFDHVIGPKGCLKKKTRILVTHHTRVLPEVDQIIVLKDGIITERGTYSELVCNEGAFSDFLKTYAAEVESDEGMSSTDGMLMDEHGSPVEFKRMVSVITQQSEVTSEQDNPGQKQEPENKIIEDETMELGRVKFSVLLSYFVAMGIIFTVLIFLSLILSTTCLVSSQIWLARWSTSNITASSENTRYLGIYAGIGIGQAIFVTSSSFLMAYASFKASTALHEKLLVNIMHLALAFFEVTPTGRILNRFSKDVDMVDSVIPTVLQQFLGSSFNVLGVVFIISFATPLFLTILFPLTLLYFITQRFYIPSSRQLKRLESVSNSPIYSHFLETLGGVSTVRAYGQEKRFILESDNLVDHNQMSYFPSVTSNRWLAIRLESIGNFLIFFTALFGVIGRDGVDSGLIGLSITVALEVTQSLNWSVRMSSELEAQIVAVERINEYSRVEREADWINEECRPPEDWPNKGVIEFERFDLRYRANLDLALRGIDCDIKQGEKVGIVGRTGAGKSTMTMALFRVVESAGGRIVIDGIPVSQLGLHDLRSRLTIIPQDPVVFTGTLRFNLDPFDQYGDEMLWKALDVTHLKSYVSNLENGLEHEVSEGGANLSVGQRQLVCLARALLRRTKILILDEATAAVDLETDELIQQTIRKEFADCTVITIAHRLNTIMDYTRIMVLSCGHIIEFDSPKSLLEKQGAFYGMAKDAKLV